MTMSAYFFSGAEILNESEYGIFGLFTSTQFSNFLYITLILGVGSFVS